MDRRCETACADFTSRCRKKRGMEISMRHVIVAGGGAAGMMAAIGAAGEGARVTLLEKNEKTGKKIYITGKGRCNLTNSCDREDFFKSIVSNEKFFYSAFNRLDNQAVMEFFSRAGCRLKEERGGRVFPLSDHSSDVIAALNREMDRLGVKIRLHTQMTQVLREDSPARHVTGVRLTGGEVLKADAVILATGGRSYEATGSTGDGYRLGREMGHTLTEPRPALVPFVVKEGWCAQMQGLSLKNVAVRLEKDKKKIYQGFGEMLFTHFGVSGPLILSAGSYYNKRFYGQKAQLHIDLKPALSREQLDTRILRDFEKNKNRLFKNALEELLPSKMIPVIVSLSCICPETKVNGITRSQRAGLEELLKNLTLTVTGTRGFSEAIVTQGGVRVKEVNPSTMESRLIRGLYFAGELLDLDAVTGGFNLQIAWSTGYLAGVSAAKEE